MEEADIEKYYEEIDSELCDACEKREFCRAYGDVICTPLAVLRILFIEKEKERIDLSDVKESIGQWRERLKKLEERYGVPELNV